jgi:hypothetical protein
MLMPERWKLCRCAATLASVIESAQVYLVSTSHALALPGRAPVQPNRRIPGRPSHGGCRPSLRLSCLALERCGPTAEPSRSRTLCTGNDCQVHLGRAGPFRSLDRHERRVETHAGARARSLPCLRRSANGLSDLHSRSCSTRGMGSGSVPLQAACSPSGRASLPDGTQSARANFRGCSSLRRRQDRAASKPDRKQPRRQRRRRRQKGPRMEESSKRRKRRRRRCGRVEPSFSARPSRTAFSEASSGKLRASPPRARDSVILTSRGELQNPGWRLDGQVGCQQDFGRLGPQGRHRARDPARDRSRGGRDCQADWKAYRHLEGRSGHPRRGRNPLSRLGVRRGGSTG